MGKFRDDLKIDNFWILILKNKIFLGLIISVLSVVIILFLVDFNLVLNTLYRVNLLDLLFIGLLYVVGFVIRTKRWINIASNTFHLPFRTAFEALVYGYAVNQILPAKLGEVFRAEYVARKGFSNRSSLFGSIFVERLFDVLILTCFLGVSIFYSEDLKLLFEGKFLVLSAVLFFIGLFLLIGIYILRGRHRVSEALNDKFRWNFRKIMLRFSESFFVFKNRAVCSMVIFHTILIWSITGGIFYLLNSNLSILIPWYGYFFIVSAGTFGMIIPSTSGNVGVYHLVAMSSLMIFGVNREDALAFAILAHAMDLLSNLAMGAIVYLLKLMERTSK